MAERVPGWLERILLPQVSELKGELKAVNAELRAVNSEIRRVEEKLGTKIDELDKRMDVSQRLTRGEEQVRELKTTT